MSKIGFSYDPPHTANHDQGPKNPAGSDYPAAGVCCGDGVFEMVGSAVVMQRMTYYERLLEYERRKKALPPMSSEEYERAIREICEELRI
jgi:hypothetical protein